MLSYATNVIEFPRGSYHCAGKDPFFFSGPLSAPLVYFLLPAVTEALEPNRTRVHDINKKLDLATNVA